MQIPKGEARRKYYIALKVALDASVDLPKHWVQEFETFENERTYSAVLATALLARATTDDVDPGALQAKAGPNGYSARGLFTHVIFANALEPGEGWPVVPLRSIGREPHNNQPFFGSAAVDEIDESRVEERRVKLFRRLKEDLTALRDLRRDEALAGFAAFLRSRLNAPVAEELGLTVPSLDVDWILRGLPAFLARGREGGSRGEAIVGAALDLIFPNVHVHAKSNDPSRHWPGDVIALVHGSTIRTRDPQAVILAVEVKERDIPPAEVLQFAANLASSGLHRGMYAAISVSQPSLPRNLQATAWSRHHVVLHVAEDVRNLVTTCLTLTSLPPATAIETFVLKVSKRLREKQALVGATDWDAFVYGYGPGGADADLPNLSSDD